MVIGYGMVQRFRHPTELDLNNSTVTHACRKRRRKSLRWEKEDEKDQRGGVGYLDVVKEDMQEVGAREDVVFDRDVWRIRYGDPRWEKSKEEYSVRPTYLFITSAIHSI